MPVTVKPVFRHEREVSQKPLVVKGRPSPDGKTPDGMVQHTRESCERKVGFKTEREAWFALRQMNREGKNCKSRVVYQCRWCGFWKIGKKPGG